MFPLASLNCWRKDHNYDKEASVLSWGQEAQFGLRRALDGQEGELLLGPWHVRPEKVHLMTH